MQKSRCGLENRDGDDAMRQFYAKGGECQKQSSPQALTVRVHLTKKQAEAAVGILFTCIAEALREGDKVEL